MYLEECGHYIYESKSYPELIRSRYGKKNRYRWLLFLCQDPDRFFSESEVKLIQQQLKLVRQWRERLYLVIGFTFVHGLIIILPADRISKKGYARVEIGGIDWDEFAVCFWGA
jgi:hypothetical protein